MTDGWNLCIANSAAGRSPAKRGLERVDTGRRQMEGRIMVPAGWWAKCDCENFSMPCKSYTVRYTFDSPDFESPIRHRYLHFWIGVSKAEHRGVGSLLMRLDIVDIYVSFYLKYRIKIGRNYIWTSCYWKVCSAV